MNIKRVAYFPVLTEVLEALNASPVCAGGDDLSLPDPGILLVLGSALMVFAFYCRIRNK